MLTRRDQIIKWSVCGTAMLVLSFLFALTLRDVKLLGVRMFLPPLFVGVVSSLEEPRTAVVFGLVCGLLCDLTMTGTLPCLYTLAFTGASLLCTMLARSVLQPGVFRSVAASVLTFAAADALNMLALALGARAPFGAMLSVALRETLVSLPLLIAVHPVLLRLHKQFTL